MPRSAVLFALCLLAAPAAALAEDAVTPPEGPARDRVREAVDAGNYFFVKAFTARDAQAIADLYTEDGRVIAPGAEPASGRTAIAAFWQNAMQDTVAARLETQGVEAAGDLAIEEGVVHLTAVDGRESTARYLVVWKRIGRRWHLHRDIWNTGPELAKQPEPKPPEPVSAPDARPGPAGDEPFPGQAEPPPREEEPAPDEEPV